jgi:hypothetical protein
MLALFSSASAFGKVRIGEAEGIEVFRAALKKLGGCVLRSDQGVVFGPQRLDSNLSPTLFHPTTVCPP